MTDQPTEVCHAIEQSLVFGVYGSNYGDTGLFVVRGNPEKARQRMVAYLAQLEAGCPMQDGMPSSADFEVLLVLGAQDIKSWQALLTDVPDRCRQGQVSRNESWYCNHYRHCGQEWTADWSCQCNDRCPVCNAEIEPHYSEEAVA